MTMAALLLALAMALAACSDIDPEEGGENATEGTPPPNDAVTVEVRLTEWEISMPDEVPAGPLAFEVTNAGSMDHSFAIEGPGGTRTLDANLTIADEDTLLVELEPGEYTVYCPIGNHREQGMEVTLTVTDGS